MANNRNDEWNPQLIANVVDARIVALTRGMGPAIGADAFNRWERRGVGVLDFELTIHLPSGRSRTFSGFHLNSSVESSKTIEEVADDIAQGVLATWQARDDIDRSVEAVRATVQGFIDDPAHRDLELRLLSIEPMALSLMPRMLAPTAVTISMTMPDAMLETVPTSFDVETDIEAASLLQQWLPEMRRRHARAALLLKASADGFVDAMTLKLIAHGGSTLRKVVAKLSSASQVYLDGPSGSLFQDIKIQRTEGHVWSECRLGERATWDGSSLLLSDISLPETVANAAMGLPANKIVACELLTDDVLVGDIVVEEGYLRMSITPHLRYFRSAKSRVWGSVDEKELIDIDLSFRPSR